jgi:hypothetical protein
MSASSIHARTRPASGLAAGILVLAAAGWTSQAQAADCTLQISRPPQSVRLDYDPFLPATAPARLAFQIRNSGTERCEADLALVDVPGLAIVQPKVQSTGLTLEIRPDAVATRSTTPSVFRVAVLPNETADVTFDVVVIEDAMVEAGLYSEDLTLELRQPGAPQFYDSAPVVIDVTALPRAQLNLSGARGAFGTGPSVSVVDFGEAQTGKTHQLFVQTRTNSAARLTFTSANRGLLVLQQDGAEDAALPYSVAFEGSTLDLSAVTTRDVDPPRTYAGQSYDLTLTLGTVSGGPAGVYSDELTIEISTL